MKKSIISLLALLPLMLLLVSCDPHKVNKAKLKADIESVQGQLPMNCGAMGVMTGMTYKDDLVSFTFSANENLVDIDGLIKDSALVKQNFQCMATLNNNIQRMINEIAEAQASLCVKYKGKESGKIAKITISNAELSNPDKFLLSREKAGEIYLDNSIKLERNKLPMDLGNGIILDDSFWEGKKLVYHATMDAGMYSAEGLANADVKGMKQSIAAGLAKESSSRTFIETLASVGRSLCYRYQVDGSNSYVDAEFSPTELKQMLGKRPSASEEEK